jgi:hypothetical protein
MSQMTLKTRLSSLQHLAQDTITAERDEMHYAIAYLADTLNEFCQGVTAIHLEPSDQGDWLTYNTVTCTTHTDPADCPATSEDAHDAAWEFPPHIYLTQIGHLVDEFDFTAPVKTNDEIRTMTITTDDVARVKEHLGMSATALHINAATLEQITAALGGLGEPINDGDCGSVWGETRLDGCPPHTILNDPTPQMVACLDAAHIGYVLTSKDDWAEMPIERHWTEPPCPHN